MIKPSAAAAFLLLVLLPLASAAPQCRPGRYLSSSGACVRCSPGSYSWGGTFTSCYPCPSDTFTPYHGVVDERLCLPCPRGFTSAPGSSRCVPSKKSLNGTKRPRTKCGKFFIPPPPGVSYFGDDVCVSPINGCPKGMRLRLWARKALCQSKRTGRVKCPSGSVFDRVDQCLSCSKGQKLVRVNKPVDGRKFRCERCSNNSVSTGGIRRFCIKCKCGYTRSSDGTTCIRTIPEGVTIKC